MIKASPLDADSMMAAVDTFLRACRRPAALEMGEPVLALAEGEFLVEVRAGKLWIEVWSDARSLSRRISGIERQSAGALECKIERFGGKPGKLTLLDLDKPQTAHKSLRGVRQNFSELFRRMLFRQFPGWKIEALSSGMDLQRSFSPVFPRGLLSRGRERIAAMACPSVAEESAMLTFALIWYDHVREQHGRDERSLLCVFLPEEAGKLTAHRLRWLTGGPIDEPMCARMFRFNGDGSAGEVDPQDLGNLETRVGASAQEEAWRRAGEGWSERYLEEAVRREVSLLDATLLPEPVHEQVLTFMAVDRNMIDLLAVSSHGRLAVIELKVSEDMHLPLQALDYWMRVRWHAERGELQQLFPGVPLDRAAPQLMLVAPAISFHSSNAAILRYFSPEIEVERIGINSGWRRRLRVVMRLRGAAAPISHGGRQWA